MAHLESKVAVVTGAGRGIGGRTAVRLAADGAAVAVIDIAEDATKDVVAEIEEAGGRAIGVGCDVSDEQSVLAAAERVQSELGSIGVLVNNAGVLRDNLLFKMSVDDWDTVMSVHLRGAFLCSRAAQRHMVAAKSGAIVNTSSVYGLIGVGNESAYCASKFAVRGFTESLRHELRGTGVRAVTIHPGGVKTNIARNGRLREDTEGWGRTPDDIAEEFEALAMTTPEAAA